MPAWMPCSLLPRVAPLCLNLPLPVHEPRQPCVALSRWDEAQGSTRIFSSFSLTRHNQLSFRLPWKFRCLQLHRMSQWHRQRNSNFIAKLSYCRRDVVRSRTLDLTRVNSMVDCGRVGGTQFPEDVLWYQRESLTCGRFGGCLCFSAGSNSVRIRPIAPTPRWVLPPFLLLLSFC